MKVGLKIASIFLVNISIVAGLGGPLGAATYPDPSKTITIIAPFAPGVTDVQFRAIGTYLSKNLGGVRVQVTNVVGASGKLAYAKIYESPPDGYTIMGFTSPAPIIAQIMDKSARFNISALVSLCAYNTSPIVLAVHVDNWKTLDEFVQEGQRRVLSIGTTGNTTGNYFQAVNMKELTKIKANIVPFEGGRQNTAALAGKHIDAAFGISATPLPLIRAGKLRPLVVFSDEPDPNYPGVPLIKDTKWNFEPFPAMSVFAAPPNLSADKQKILEEAFAKSFRDPEFIKWAKSAGVDIRFRSAEEVKVLMDKVHRGILEYKSYLPQE